MLFYMRGPPSSSSSSSLLSSTSPLLFIVADINMLLLLYHPFKTWKFNIFFQNVTWFSALLFFLWFTHRSVRLSQQAVNILSFSPVEVMNLQLWALRPPELSASFCFIFIFAAFSFQQTASLSTDQLTNRDQPAAVCVRVCDYLWLNYV